MNYIWLTSSTAAQTGAFAQADIFNHKQKYCDRIVGDMETKIGTKLANQSTFVLIKILNMCSF